MLDTRAVVLLLFWLVLTEESNASFHLAGIKSPPASKRFVWHIDQRWMQLLGNLQHGCSSIRMHSLQYLKSQALLLGHRTLRFGHSHFSWLLCSNVLWASVLKNYFFHRLVWHICENSVFVLHGNAKLHSVGLKVPFLRSTSLWGLRSQGHRAQGTQKFYKYLLKSISLYSLA